MVVGLGQFWALVRSDIAHQPSSSQVRSVSRETLGGRRWHRLLHARSRAEKAVWWRLDVWSVFACAGVWVRCAKG